MLVERLSVEHVDDIAHLQPLIFHSYLCPCRTCAACIANFARSRPGLRIELAYERDFVPAKYARFRSDGSSDASSIAEMRAAGISVGRLGTSLVSTLLDSHVSLLQQRTKHSCTSS